MLLNDCIQVKPKKEPNVCIIWLHGLGANGHDFEPIVPHLEINPEIRPWFVFPNAPKINVTINNSMMMPAWYDIFELNKAPQAISLCPREPQRDSVSDGGLKSENGKF